MSDLAATFKNPYVIGGGVLVGLILMMSAHKANGATSGGPVTADPVYTTAVLENNKAAMAATTAQAGIAAGVATQRISADMTLGVATLNTIQNADNNRALVAKQAIMSNEGIIKSQIETASATTIDINNNMARLGLAQEQTHQVQIQTNGAVDIAHAQASAVKHAADVNAIGNIVKTAASVIAAPFTGGASLAMLPSNAAPDLAGLY